jgi:nucleotide-binding universal stress UspA family protein
MIALKKVLVATDFSGPSEAALAYGRELARSFSAQLVVLHVVENTLIGAVAANGYVFTDPELQKTVEAAGQRRVEHLLGAKDRAGLRARAVIVTSNAPADAIVEYAKDSGINLIVLGTHGRGVMAHLLLGSVAERVVRIAPCPVLTVRHPEREFVLPDAHAVLTHAAR